MYNFGNTLTQNYLSYISVLLSSSCFQFYFGRPFHGVSPLKYVEGALFS